MGPGRILIIAGIVLLAAGLVFTLAGRFGFGSLPGDIVMRRNRWTFYFPLATSVLLSIILTVVLWLFSRK